MPLLGALLLASLPMVPPVLDGVHPLANVLPRLAVLAGCLAAIYYLNVEVGAARLLARGQRSGYGLFAVALVVAGTATAALLVPPPRMARPAQSPAPRAVAAPVGTMFVPHRYTFVLVRFISVVLVVGVGAQVASARHEQQQGRRAQLLEQEKQQVELSYLKQQLNPHFFFNTLNNVYALTEVDVPQAQLALYHLSRLMRYVLYQTQEPAVLLSQEVTFLQDYISLMRLRLTDNMQLDFTIPALLDDRTIAPLLLLPFLENAFKYGVSTEEPATICFTLSQDGPQLALEVRNRIFAPHRTTLAEGSGIGLANTRRRLQLLYPGRHALRITERTPAGEFAVHLTLQLSA